MSYHDRMRRLHDERGQAMGEARALVDAAEADGNRALSAEEQGKFDAAMATAEARRVEVDQLSRLIEADRAEERALAEAERDARGAGPGRAPAGEARAANDRTAAEVVGFRSYLRHGHAGLDGPGAAEFRALQASQGGEGGYLVAPMQMANMLIERARDLTMMRQLGTVYPVEGAVSLGVPTLEVRPDDADWTTELAEVADDDAMRFGRRELRPHDLTKQVRVSMALLRSGAMDPERIVLDQLAYKFAVPEERNFMVGDGANKPLGVFTASDDGIPASRDVVGDNTSTQIKADALFDVKYSLKQTYWSGASWLFSRAAAGQIAKLKGSDGHYLMKQGLTAGDPDVLHGHPMRVSEFAPDTFAAGERVGVFGDFRHYWIADGMGLEIQRLNELYARRNRIGFIGRKRVDGAPVLAEAFARVRLAP